MFGPIYIEESYIEVKITGKTKKKGYRVRIQNNISGLEMNKKDEISF